MNKSREIRRWANLGIVKLYPRLLRLLTSGIKYYTRQFGYPENYARGSRGTKAYTRGAL